MVSRVTSPCHHAMHGVDGMGWDTGLCIPVAGWRRGCLHQLPRAMTVPPKIRRLTSTVDGGQSRCCRAVRRPPGHYPAARVRVRARGWAGVWVWAGVRRIRVACVCARVGAGPACYMQCPHASGPRPADGLLHRAPACHTVPRLGGWRLAIRVHRVAMDVPIGRRGLRGRGLELRKL
jgi:hypothetical protein